MRKKLAVLLITVFCIAGMVLGIRSYYDFVSNTIYSESTAHLTEILHQANLNLYNLVSDKWNQMEMWTPYLESADSEADIAEYLEKAQNKSHFTDFYFISRNSEYMTLDGSTGYLDLRNKLSDLILDQKSIVANSVVPDQPEIMVFAIPTAKGSYREFEYEAIAITYNNTDLVKALKTTSFDGQAGTYAVLDDGRVVLDNGSKYMSTIHNVLAFVEECDHVTDEILARLKQEFKEGKTGAMLVSTEGRSYYLLYDSAGFQNWTVVCLVPSDVVNSNMNNLQYITIFVVSAIAVLVGFIIILMVIQQNRLKLKRMDNALISRDELFA